VRRSLSGVDLFSGGGGFSRGFIEEGFNILLGIDNERSAARTYVANFPEVTVLAEDIRNISCREIREIIGRNTVDVVIGSPPCEPFTGANPARMPKPLDRLYKDPAGRLVLEFIRFLECLTPKVYIMENVPALTEGELTDALRNEFRRAGYEAHFNILRAQDYGTPSRRVRVFLSNLRLSPPKTREKIRVIDAIGDLPEPEEDPVIPNHDPPPRLSKRKMKRVMRTSWGRSAITYEGAHGRRLPNFIRLDPYRLAPTVLGSSRFIHPFENRLLTVREQARLMGYPDNHVFLGGKDEQYNQVGESVPPPLAKALAREVLKYLEV